MLTRSDVEFCAPHCRTCAALRRAAAQLVGERGIDHVMLDEIAAVAGVGESDAARHVGEDAVACIGAAYLESAAELQSRFVAAFEQQTAWRDGLAAATRTLLETLADDPARARFCYVEVLEGPREVAALREQVRARSVDLFGEQYRARRRADPVPRLHLEVTNGAIIHAIERSARARRTDELPGLADAIVATVEPQALDSLA